jgi:hypothetical protein
MRLGLPRTGLTAISDSSTWKRSKELNINKDKLEAEGFTQWGEILLNEKDDVIRFDATSSMKDTREGFVYVWMEAKSSDELVKLCYIGKAGKKLTDRWRDHKGGFKRSTTGMGHANRIRLLFARKSRLLVWVKHSKPEKLFGVEVSRCCIEEVALIKAWTPCWNSETNARKSSRI